MIDAWIIKPNDENTKLYTVSNTDIMSSMPTEHKQKWAGRDEVQI